MNQDLIYLLDRADKYFYGLDKREQTIFKKWLESTKHD